MAENNNENKRLLTVKEAAEYLGISESALRKRIFLGQMEGLIRLGGRRYFDRPKLEKFIDELTIDSRYKKTHNRRYANEKN
jgi:excisionase family DNA binding protein